MVLMNSIKNFFPDEKMLSLSHCILLRNALPGSVCACLSNQPKLCQSTAKILVIDISVKTFDCYLEKPSGVIAR